MPATAPASMRHLSLPLLLVTAAVALLLGGAVALWVHYGTTVFYEMILAGLVACF
jgi:hypothetical protein